LKADSLVEKVNDIDDLRYRIRHSTAHVMADIVSRMFPDAELGIGPPTDDGFYYDFNTSHRFVPDDLIEIEKQMRDVISKDLKFNYQEYSRSDILAIYQDSELKSELINEIEEDEIISTFSHGEFEDLCAGPHVPSTGKIPAFKLLRVAGAYWRGDENRPMLQRIYGTAWESQKALDEYLERMEQARLRDHRVLGRELDLFSLHEEIGPGLIVWHPKGAQLRSTVEDFWKKKHIVSGYDFVNTPHVGRSKLWQTSGHLDFFQENMFANMEMDNQDYYVKPMNCPFHIMYYKTATRSYRDLPIRSAELGTVYRFEPGGVLHGLMRARGFTQDDAHIFCTPDQVESEIDKVLDLTFEIMEAFEFKEFQIMLSTRPDKAVGSEEQWDLATQSVQRTLEDRGIDFQVDEGGGAFYGPKIDVHIKDAIGRLWQCTTVQFDFNLPDRFGLKYIGEDGLEHQPYMIHRAIFGSLERFLGILIEHFGGAFPVWLAPTQVTIVPIADRHNDYAFEVAGRLMDSNIRVSVDDRGERMNAKIRLAQMQKIPYVLVLGDRELDAKTASVRQRGGEDLGVLGLQEIVKLISNSSD